MTEEKELPKGNPSKIVKKVRNDGLFEMEDGHLELYIPRSEYERVRPEIERIKSESLKAGVKFWC